MLSRVRFECLARIVSITAAIADTAKAITAGTTTSTTSTPLHRGMRTYPIARNLDCPSSASGGPALVEPRLSAGKPLPLVAVAGFQSVSHAPRKTLCRFVELADS